jgi:hypothetical protein
LGLLFSVGAKSIGTAECEFNELGGRQSTFSALQTTWRKAQSGANLSPAKFPANRENNREFRKLLASKTALLLSKLHIRREKYLTRPKSEQGINRHVSGNLIP